MLPRNQASLAFTGNFRHIATGLYRVLNVRGDARFIFNNQEPALLTLRKDDRAVDGIDLNFNEVVVRIQQFDAVGHIVAGPLQSDMNNFTLIFFIEYVEDFFQRRSLVILNRIQRQVLVVVAVTVIAGLGRFRRVRRFATATPVTTVVVAAIMAVIMAVIAAMVLMFRMLAGVVFTMVVFGKSSRRQRANSRSQKHPK